MHRLFPTRLLLTRRPDKPRHRLRLNELEPRIVPSVSLTNVDGNLAALYRLTYPSADPVGNVVESVELLNSLILHDSTGRPLIQIWAKADTDAVVHDLATLGFAPALTDPTHRLVEAVVDLDRLPDIAALASVLSVTPAYQAVSRSGSVPPQGDTVMHSDLVVDAGFDGCALKVGVISDSALNVAISQTTGDLPTPVDRYLEIGGTDEGRAMMEIVHDIAPAPAWRPTPDITATRRWRRESVNWPPPAARSSSMISAT